MATDTVDCIKIVHKVIQLVMKAAQLRDSFIE